MSKKRKTKLLLGPQVFIASLILGAALSGATLGLRTDAGASFACAEPSGDGPLAELGLVRMYQGQRGFPIAYVTETLSTADLPKNCINITDNAVSVYEGGFKPYKFAYNTLFWSAVSFMCIQAIANRRRT